MSKYAKTTTVAPEKTRAEIEKTLLKYGATAYAYATKGSQAILSFEMFGYQVKYDIKLPQITDPIFRGMTSIQKQKAFDQRIRQIWRVYLLRIKAKLEALLDEFDRVDKEEFKREFLAYIVLPDGNQVKDYALEQLDSGKPILLGPGGHNP